MAQFNFNWLVFPDPNSTGQRASYRQKSVGGAWITAGFTPANDLSAVATSTQSPVLLDNIVYEFKIENLCAVGGPTINDNGIIEALKFACIAPVTSQDFESADISIDVTGLDITKARFTLRLASNNNIVSGPTTVTRIGNSISHSVTGLADATNYYWQIELIATVNSIEVVSPAICSPYPFTTDADPTCDPVTALDVSSIEIL
jgi:hypothetical protein